MGKDHSTHKTIDGTINVDRHTDINHVKIPDKEEGWTDSRNLSQLDKQDDSTRETKNYTHFERTIINAFWDVKGEITCGTDKPRKGKDKTITEKRLARKEEKNIIAT